MITGFEFNWMDLASVVIGAIVGYFFKGIKKQKPMATTKKKK